MCALWTCFLKYRQPTAAGCWTSGCSVPAPAQSAHLLLETQPASPSSITQVWAGLRGAVGVAMSLFVLLDPLIESAEFKVSSNVAPPSFLLRAQCLVGFILLDPLIESAEFKAST